MANLPIDWGIPRGAWLALVLGVFVLGGSVLLAGGPGALPAEEPVVAVKIVGNVAVPQEKVLQHLHTRAGRPFRSEVVEDDVRRLSRTGMFVDVMTFRRQVPGGIEVIYQVVERPRLAGVHFVGNKKLKAKLLQKQIDLAAGDALDPYAIEQARRKIEDFYQTRGFAKARVSIWEGDKPEDRRAVFLINEGQKQKVLRTEFVGNTIASDSLLRTRIESKPGVFWLIGGEADIAQIEEDCKRLKAYYSSLGFARARIGRELLPVGGGEWLVLRFVIAEGPRFRVRSISFFGNEKFSSEELAARLALKDGKYFNQKEMISDVAGIQEAYGSDGYIFAKVDPEMRWLEDQDQFDVVYHISEGDRYRVGRINVEILGENPHTRITTVLNRLSFGPGDIVDVRRLRESERRLIRSGLFEVDPAQGNVPTIVFSLPELEDSQPQLARPPGASANFRGQSPDLEPAGAWRVTPSADSQPGDRLADLTLPCRRVDAAAAPGGAPEASAQPQSSSAAVPERPLVVRAQFTPDGGRAVPPLQPSQPWPAAQVPPSGYSVRTPPSALSSNLAEPIPPGVEYPTRSPVGSGLPPGGGTPPMQVPVNEGVLADNPRFYDDLLEDRAIQTIDIGVPVRETQTGRFMLGAGVNSDLGVMASIMVDEQNFDWKRLPRSWDEVWRGVAWRGAGQRFRFEAVPGTEVQRYMINFQDPYLMDSQNSLGLSASFYDRRYYEWDEQRLNGRISVGRQLVHSLAGDLTASFAFRGEKINVHDPVVPAGSGVTELDEVVGDNALYGFGFQVAYDTRDSAFLATEGHLIELGFEQVLGTFTYPRAEVDLRKYFLIHQRPDESGRHVLSVSTRFGWTGTDTPIYDHYYAGGFSTIRGFNFRSVAPRHPAWGIVVGGEMRLLASIQYLFPITADDMMRGVVFCDTGTVERRIDTWSDHYRVAPGVGLRLTIPAMGPAPIALDFAFPVSTNPGDQEEVFSFFIGFNN